MQTDTMKLKPRIRLNEAGQVRTKVQIGNFEDARDNFHSVFSQANKRLVERVAELDALKLCIVAKYNMMIEGLHGIAKSQLALELFSRIEGATIYKKQLMKGTDPDEIFGPIIMKKYRESAEIERNTQGYLPTAHFAFIDEVYRASDMILPSMLEILNEKTYTDGVNQVNCPLVTAIGTTNFVTDSEELEAFHDRWLVKSKAKPLSNGQARTQMLRLFINKDKTEKETIDLNQIMILQKAAAQVKIDDSAIELYEEVITHFRRNFNNIYISDRRLCQALRLAQAATVLHSESDDGEAPKVLEPSMLAYTRFGIITLNDKDQETKFNDAFEHHIGTYEKLKQENDDMDQLEQAVSSFTGEYDEKMTRNAAKALYEEVKKVMSGIANMDDSEQPTSVINRERLGKCTHKLNELMKELQEIRGKQI